MKTILTTIEMELAIAGFFGIRQNIIVPNISWGLLKYECDVLIITKSACGIEVEIKRSKSDMQADFKKRHKHDDPRIREFYYCFPFDIYESCKDLVPEEAGILVVYQSIYHNYAKEEKKPVIRKNWRKLTKEEIYTAARLGSMRIWNLKNTIINLKKDKKKAKKSIAKNSNQQILI
jgi:hypothetical protein